MEQSRASGDDPGMAQAPRRRTRKNDTHAAMREARDHALKKSSPVLVDDLGGRKRRACEKMRCKVTTP
jgi:hypothetical protein